VPSFDDLVGHSQQLRRYGEAEYLGGLEIDRQLVFGRSLHRQISRLLALKYSIDVTGRPSELIDQTRPIRDQATAGNEKALKEDGGQLTVNS
jgi:hypothetical protein